MPVRYNLEHLSHARLTSFVLYETCDQFLLVGHDTACTFHRLLRISKSDGGLGVTQDKPAYSKKELHRVIEEIHQSRAHLGGVSKVADVCGIVGFVRFLEGYYLIAITKKVPVAEIGGHEIYSIGDTMFIPLAPEKGKGETGQSSSPASKSSTTTTTTTSSSSSSSSANGNNGSSFATPAGDQSQDQQQQQQQQQQDDTPLEHAKYSASAEAKYRSLFAGVRLTRDFFFSPTYDLTHTLQYHMCAGMRKSMQKKEAENGNDNSNDSSNNDDIDGHEGLGRFQEMFVWNHYLLSNFAEKVSDIWITPIIHGFVSQQRLSVMGRTVNITLIARRSRFFAGTRFLKRGCNDLGDVANDVETEQIVHEATTDTRTHSHYSSVVQMRGSIPLFWGQEGGLTHPKPDIVVTRFDPYYTATRLHFETMFRRYGAPIHIFNLVKSREKVRREMILRDAFGEAITYLNRFLPDEAKLQYMAWDMHRAAKVEGEDVYGILAEMAQIVLARTGFFHTGRELRTGDGDSGIRGAVQCGVLRTNCIDCLDRTNLAQFSYGRVALGYQLYEMGILSTPTIDKASDLTPLLHRMYEQMGDRIAMQYAGSHVIPSSHQNVHGQASKSLHGRAIITSIRRFYSNSFTDAEKQDAMNVFLGYFEPRREKLHIWELEDDYFLHSDDPPPTGDVAIDWYTEPLKDFESRNFPPRKQSRKKNRHAMSGNKSNSNNNNNGNDIGINCNNNNSSNNGNVGEHGGYKGADREDSDADSDSDDFDDSDYYDYYDDSGDSTNDNDIGNDDSIDNEADDAIDNNDGSEKKKKKKKRRRKRRTSKVDGSVVDRKERRKRMMTRRATLHCLSHPRIILKKDRSGKRRNASKLAHQDDGDSHNNNGNGNDNNDNNNIGGDNDTKNDDQNKTVDGNEKPIKNRAGWFEQIYRPDEMVSFDELLDKPYNRAVEVSIGDAASSNMPGEQGPKLAKAKKMLRHATERFSHLKHPDILAAGVPGKRMDSYHQSSYDGSPEFAGSVAGSAAAGSVAASRKPAVTKKPWNKLGGDLSKEDSSEYSRYLDYLALGNPNGNLLAEKPDHDYYNRYLDFAKAPNLTIGLHSIGHSRDSTRDPTAWDTEHDITHEDPHADGPAGAASPFVEAAATGIAQPPSAFTDESSFYTWYNY